MVSNEDFKLIFIDKIEEIINIMKDIIYTPPYSILFGRINIEKPKECLNQNLHNINEFFYAGFTL